MSVRGVFVEVIFDPFLTLFKSLQTSQSFISDKYLEKIGPLKIDLNSVRLIEHKINFSLVDQKYSTVRDLVKKFYRFRIGSNSFVKKIKKKQVKKKHLKSFPNVTNHCFLFDLFFLSRCFFFKVHGSFKPNLKLIVRWRRNLHKRPGSPGWCSG